MGRLRQTMMVPPEDRQVVAHLYRGEMNRMTVYRQRLDTTTHWAITLETAILVVYLGSDVGSAFICFPLMVLLFLSFLEARRYRYFYTSAKRVQCLEVGFFAKQIFQRTTDDQFYILLNNLQHVQLWIGLWPAWVVRFYRNYIWLCYISLAMMTYKHLSVVAMATSDLCLMASLYAGCIGVHMFLYVCYHRLSFVDL
jgi:uncharacterized membrane protein